MPCLHLIDTRAEPLRGLHRAATIAAASHRLANLVYDFAGCTFPSAPYRTNLPGWRHTLRKHAIQELHAWQPDNRFWAILLAGRLEHLPLTLHLDEPLDRLSGLLMRLLLPRVQAVIATAEFLAAPLRDRLPDPRRMQVVKPSLPADRLDEASVVRLRERLLTAQTRFLVLVTPPPANHTALLGLVWAAALVRHVRPDVRLVVSGPASSRDRGRLKHWEKNLDSPGLIVLDTEAPFGHLVQAADVVLTGSEAFRETLRLAAVMAAAGRADTGILTSPGETRGPLRAAPGVRVARSGKPRHLAGTLLEILEARSRYASVGA